jgi:hypothetical protein
VLLFSGGASFSEAELVLIFLSSLAIIFPDADLSDQVEQFGIGTRWQRI